MAGRRRREIRVSMLGRDLAGIRFQKDDPVFYTCDRQLNIHNTGHNRRPEQGFPAGVVKSTREPGLGGEAAGAVWIEMDETFSEPLRVNNNAVPLGSILLTTDS